MCRLDGVIALAELLKSNTTITDLNLNENNLKDVGAKAIAEALKVNTTLKVLDLSLNYIGDEGAQALAEAIDANSTLEQLSISGNDIKDADLRRKLRARRPAAPIASFHAPGPSIDGMPSRLVKLTN